MSKNYLRNNDKTQRLPEEANVSSDMIWNSRGRIVCLPRMTEVQSTLVLILLESVIIRGAEAFPASKNTGPDLQFGSCTEGFFDRHGGLVLTRLG